MTSHGFVVRKASVAHKKRDKAQNIYMKKNCGFENKHEFFPEVKESLIKTKKEHGVRYDGQA